MADFCRQCSIARFGKDHKDMAWLTLWGKTAVLCEDCGPTWVNRKGECVGDCWKHHRPDSKTAT